MRRLSEFVLLVLLAGCGGSASQQVSIPGSTGGTGGNPPPTGTTLREFIVIPNLSNNTITVKQVNLVDGTSAPRSTVSSGGNGAFVVKCNPAIKSRAHRDALLPALLDNRLDVIATDHAPHTREEKALPYLQAPSGLPLIQHTLNVMLEFYHTGEISLERIVEKMCHAPAIAFRVAERGFLDEGYWADLAIVDLNQPWTVQPENLYYKCGWSPFEGKRFHGKVLSTIVSGHLAWHEGRFNEGKMGERLVFAR